MAYHFAVFDHVNSLPPEWHSLASADSAMNSINIGVQDIAQIGYLKSYYLIVSQNEQPVFLMYFQLLQVIPDHFNLGSQRFQQFGLSTALRIVKPTLLVAGNLFRHDAFFLKYVNPEGALEEKAALYRDSVDFMVAKTNASGIFLKDVPADIALSIRDDTSYTAFENDISMEIKIPAHWQTFVDYEKALKHKYLQRCKKIRKSFDGIQIRELSQNEIGQYSKQLFDLYMQVTRKQIVSMGMLNAAFFVELKTALKERYRVCGFFLEDKLIAFSSAILHHNEYDMNYIGIDYAYNQSHHLYFNILFHCLESAITTKCSKLILGRTAPEAKAIVGCIPDYRHSFHKLRNPVVNWFFQRVSKYFTEQQGEHWKERHPFKSQYYEESLG